MRTKYRYNCIDCPGEYVYYYPMRFWTCPNCKSGYCLVTQFVDTYDESDL